MPHKFLVAGVGRSGTSFLFQEIATALLDQGPSKFFYEPYLWDPKKVNETGQIHREPFDTRNLSPFGIYTHCESPIFLRGKHPVHDQMVNRILGSDGNVMSKMIRGNGRLRPYLDADPELKVIGIMRDVFGTVNSVSNHFSFFGTEFHPTDRPRFRDEVKAAFQEDLDIPPDNPQATQAVWSAYWWKYHTRALLETKRAYPDRICLIDYDSLRDRPDEAYQTMDAFLGIPLSRYRSSSRVGIVSGASYLSEIPPEHFRPFQDWFRGMVTDEENDVFLSGESASLAEIEAVVKRFPKSRPAVVSRYPEYRTGIGWRYAQQALQEEQDRLQALREKAFQQHQAASPHHFDLRPATSTAADTPQVSVIIPFWNAEDTLEQTVVSVWAQVGVRAEVILVDDASTDGSPQVAERLLEKGPGLLIRNKRNLGPGLSRHKGILQARAATISTLDADDYMYPFKLARELDALGDDPMAVAYSQVEYVRFMQSQLWDYADLTGLDKTAFLAAIASRRSRIPRDMTFSRALYDRTQGFDGLLRMYEDFAFKIELAATASRWINTGELGMRYDHAATGASAAGPGKHVFFLHAAFLKNAEMLALRFEKKTVDHLQGAVSSFGISPFVAQSLDLLRERMAFPGNILGDLRKMRKEVFRHILREDMTFDDRLRYCYEQITLPQAGA